MYHLCWSECALCRFPACSYCSEGEIEEAIMEYSRRARNRAICPRLRGTSFSAVKREPCKTFPASAYSGSCRQRIMDIPSDKSTPCTLERLNERSESRGAGMLEPWENPNFSTTRSRRSTLLKDLGEPYSRSNGYTPSTLPSSVRRHVLEPCSVVGSAPGAGGGIRIHEGLRHGRNTPKG